MCLTSQGVVVLGPARKRHRIAPRAWGMVHSCGGMWDIGRIVHTHVMSRCCKSIKMLNVETSIPALTAAASRSTATKVGGRKMAAAREGVGAASAGALSAAAASEDRFPPTHRGSHRLSSPPANMQSSVGLVGRLASWGNEGGWLPDARG